jgi:hypothetical protein
MVALVGVVPVVEDAKLNSASAEIPALAWNADRSAVTISRT